MVGLNATDSDPHVNTQSFPPCSVDILINLAYIVMWKWYIEYFQTCIYVDRDFEGKKLLKIFRLVRGNVW